MHNGLSVFNEEAINISAHFPSLKYVENGDLSSIQGELVLLDQRKEFVDSYKISIVGNQHYPFMFPYVFETGGRIPINEDWHIYPKEGNCCIKSFPEELIICKKGISLCDFIEKQVKPYFFNQLHRESKGYFLKERAHGDQGNIEYFEDLFETKNRSNIVEHLQFIKLKREPSRVKNCFCGSGLKYRKCHRKAFRELMHLSNGIFDIFIRIVRTTV